MPRTETIVGGCRWLALATTEIVETYTLKMVREDGKVIRHDGADLWSLNGKSWYGTEPWGWDPSKAVEEKYTATYTIEDDYS